MIGFINKKKQQIITYLNQKKYIPENYPFIMHEREKQLFKKYIVESKNYLEFGLGGSTIFTLLHSNANIVSVDTNKKWIRFMEGYRLIKRSLGDRLVIHYVDIGPTKNWGYPVDEEKAENFYKFSSSVFQLRQINDVDTILVDGRFRVACVLQSVLQCGENKGLKILIHDYSFREEYHVVEKYLDLVEKVQSLYVFEIKNDADVQKIKQDYERYKNQAI